MIDGSKVIRRLWTRLADFGGVERLKSRPNSLSRVAHRRSCSGLNVINDFFFGSEAPEPQHDYASLTVKMF
jgi:hypothetical protein